MIMVKKIIFIIGYGLVIVSLAGCSLMHHKAGAGIVSGRGILPSYSGPKARIAVVDFNVKAAKAAGEIGVGLREMLITALINSNRYAIVERQAQVAQEPDLIITASVSEFDPQTSGGRAGVGGGGGVGSGVLGGLLGSSLNKAHMVLDISIVDTSTSKPLAATRVHGQASDVGRAIKGIFSGSGGLGAGLSVYANTPMEKAIRICIIEAVRYMSSAIPVSYYKYNPKG